MCMLASVLDSTFLRKHSFGFYLQGRLSIESSEFRWIKERLCPPQRAGPVATCSGSPCVQWGLWDEIPRETRTQETSAHPGTACGEELPTQLGSTDGIRSDKASDSSGSVANERVCEYWVTTEYCRMKPRHSRNSHKPLDKWKKCNVVCLKGHWHLLFKRRFFSAVSVLLLSAS